MGKQVSAIDGLVEAVQHAQTKCRGEIARLQEALKELERAIDQKRTDLSFHLQLDAKLSEMAELNGHATVAAQLSKQPVRIEMEQPFTTDAPFPPQNGGPATWVVLKGETRSARVWQGRRYLSCCNCNKWKLTDEFHRRSNSRHGRQPWCKQCMHAWGEARASQRART